MSGKRRRRSPNYRRVRRRFRRLDRYPRFEPTFLILLLFTAGILTVLEVCFK